MVARRAHRVIHLVLRSPGRVYVVGLRCPHSGRRRLGEHTHPHPPCATKAFWTNAISQLKNSSSLLGVLRAGPGGKTGAPSHERFPADLPVVWRVQRCRVRRRHPVPLAGSPTPATELGGRRGVPAGALWLDRQAEVGDRLRTAPADHPRSLIVDTSRSGHFSDARSGAFVSTGVTAHQAQVRLLVRGASPQAWQSLRWLGVARVFEQPSDSRRGHLCDRRPGRGRQEVAPTAGDRG